MRLSDIPEAWGKTVKAVCKDGYTVIGPYDGYENGADSGEDREILHIAQTASDGFRYIEGVYVDEIESFEVLDG